MAKRRISSYIVKLNAIAIFFGMAMLLIFNSIWYKYAVRQPTMVKHSHVNFHLNKTTTITSNPLLFSPSPVNPEDLISILRYHAEERRWCEQKIANSTETNWCPCVPSGLHGRVFVNMVDNWDWDRIADAVGSDVLAGGEWQPKDCVSSTRLAVVIPCRDREHHLRILLRHLIPILKRQLVHFRIFVVDQRLPAVFNKAVMMNIGFLEAAKRFRFDCVIFHDVDMILEDDRAIMTCSTEPRHYAQAVDKYEYSCYPTFAQVVSINSEQFRRINGYPLRYFGWGGEDDDMWSRVSNISSIYKPASAVARYSTIPHGGDVTNRKNPRRHALLAVRSYEGLSDLNYNVNDVQLMPLFTRIEADINITNLLASYPSQPSSQYIRTVGTCLDGDVIMTLDGISWNSCRFLCDSFPDKPCFGFSHLRGTCTIIRTFCKLTLKDGTWTFVKDTQFILGKKVTGGNY